MIQLARQTDSGSDSPATSRKPKANSTKAAGYCKFMATVINRIVIHTHTHTFSIIPHVTKSVKRASEHMTQVATATAQQFVAAAAVPRV